MTYLRETRHLKTMKYKKKLQVRLDWFACVCTATIATPSSQLARGDNAMIIGTQGFWLEKENIRLAGSGDWDLHQQNCKLPPGPDNLDMTHVTSVSRRPKKKLFGCLPPPAPNFWKLEKSFYCTKVYRP